VPYIGRSLGSGRRIAHNFTATANQQTFNLPYTPSFIDVFQNGVLLSPTDYTATDGATVVLAVGASLNDEITVISHKTFNAADSVSASSGGTFSGVVNFADNVNITGDLTVDGTTTTINSTTLEVDDLNITVASGAADAASANGAGLTVDGANATLNYSSAGDIWEINKGLGLVLSTVDDIILEEVGSSGVAGFHSSSTTTSILAIDATNNRVGIGLDEPTALFEVNGGTGVGSQGTSKVIVSGNDALVQLGDLGSNSGSHGIQFGYDNTSSDGMSILYRTASDAITFEDSSGISGNSVMSILQSGVVGIGTQTPQATLDIGSTDSVKLPVGSTAEQSSSPVTGMIRYNSSDTKFEVYNSTWLNLVESTKETAQVTLQGSQPKITLNLGAGGNSEFSIDGDTTFIDIDPTNTISGSEFNIRIDGNTYLFFDGTGTTAYQPFVIKGTNLLLADDPVTPGVDPDFTTTITKGITSANRTITIPDADGEIVLYNNGIVFEGSTADDFETLLSPTDPTQDNTITLPDASGTVALTDVSGNLQLTGTLTATSVLTDSVVFEGSIADDFETTIAVTNPTADRTVTLPDATGTVITTGNLNNITSVGTLVNDVTISSADLDVFGRIGVGLNNPGDFNSNANDVVIGDGSAVHGLTIYSSAGTSGNIYFADSPTGTNAYKGYITYNQSTNVMSFGTAFTERMTIGSTGDVNLVGNLSAGDVNLVGNLIFEGATADNFETTLTVEDPTQDNTITLPNHSGHVIVGDATSTSDDKIFISSTNSQRPRIILQNDQTGSSSRPELHFQRTTTSVSDGMDLGIIRFVGKDSAGADTLYAYIFAEMSDVTNGSEDGRLTFQCFGNGASNGARFVIDGTGGNDDPDLANFEFSGNNTGYVMHVERTVIDQGNQGAVLGLSLGEDTGPEDDPWIDFINYGTTGTDGSPSTSGDQNINGSISTVNGNQGIVVFGQENLLLRAEDIAKVTQTVSTTGYANGIDITTGMNILNKSSFTTTREKIATISAATGVVAHNYNSAQVFYHTAPAADFTVNITNMDTASSYVYTVSVVVVQGATPRVPTALQIDGVATTVNYSAGTAFSSSNANGVDVFVYNLFRIGSSWTVIANEADYS